MPARVPEPRRPRPEIALPILDTALARKSTQGCVKALMRRQGGQSSARRSLQTATIANGRVLL